MPQPVRRWPRSGSAESPPRGHRASHAVPATQCRGRRAIRPPASFRSDRAALPWVARNPRGHASAARLVADRAGIVRTCPCPVPIPDPVAGVSHFEDRASRWHGRRNAISHSDLRPRPYCGTAPAPGEGRYGSPRLVGLEGEEENDEEPRTSCRHCSVIADPHAGGGSAPRWKAPRRALLSRRLPDGLPAAEPRGPPAVPSRLPDPRSCV